MTVVILGRILQASPKTRARQAKLANGEDVLAGDGPIRASGMSETEAMRSTCHPELPGGPPLIRCAPTRAPSADEHPRPRPAATMAARTIGRRSVAWQPARWRADTGSAQRRPSPAQRGRMASAGAPRRQPRRSSRATSGTAVASAESLVVIARRALVQLQRGDFLGGELVQVPGLLLDPDELGLVFEQRLRQPVRQVVVHRPVDHQ